MKPNKNQTQNLAELAIPLTGNDALEYFRIRNGLIEVLERVGGYEPAIDNIHIDTIARNIIFQRKADTFLTSDKANEYTFVSVADAKVKFAKIIDNALNHLAISRRNRFDNRTEASLMTELKEIVMRGLHDPEK